MCGIVAAIAKKNIVPTLLEGLRRLEYRGYDSAGIGILDSDDEFVRVRSVGKIENLAKKLADEPCAANMGIAQTRWATHGKPSEVNAHPHIAGDIMVVHNGIIENYAELKATLINKGCHFHSETDTEVVACLLNDILDTHTEILDAIRTLCQQLKGAFALVIMHRHHHEQLWAVRQGAPLVLGLGVNENFIASDPLSLLPLTQKFIYLEEADCAQVSDKTIKIVDVQGKEVTREVQILKAKKDAAAKGQYKYFMQKEIFEQPQMVTDILTPIFEDEITLMDLFGKNAHKILPQVERIKIVACGTSYHSGLVAKYWLEAWAKIPCDVEIASEFRYRDSCNDAKTLLIAISQSGETADTLAALRLAKKQNFLATLALCNVATSALAREADLVYLAHAGTEIGVAATKTFTSQLLGLYLLAALLAQKKQKDLLMDLLPLPNVLNEVLKCAPAIEKIAHDFQAVTNALFLGRGVHYPIAMEGALKLKEISYIHAESYAAGELKHGALALVDEHMPTVVLVPHNTLVDKLKSNIEEIAARGGPLYLFVDEAIVAAHEPWQGKIITLPKATAALSPFVETIALQLFAFHVAVLKGTDVDQPRNLAKSVTVE
jgi:glucosamine--fructose-6-phosphate aminotransferase (isomerizing)